MQKNNKIILGIDPGQNKSGVVWWNSQTGKVERGEHMENDYVLDCISKGGYDMVGIEQIRSYRLVAGNDTIDTIWWSGRFYETALCTAVPDFGQSAYMIPRKTKEGAVHHLCGQDGAGDKGVRQALIDRLGEPGKKKNPGNTFGVSGHLWAALAVAVVCYDKYGRGNR